jgi:hypothetical protein
MLARSQLVANPAFVGGDIETADFAYAHEKISMPPWGRLGWLLHLYFGMDAGLF